jgi:Zn-dependent M28 family amino/carboxypeptidase
MNQAFGGKRISAITLALGTALFLIGLGFPGCGQKSEESLLRPSLESITADDLSKDTQLLASDDFEGRGLASDGETKTIYFLRDEFQKIGLEPGNGASYFQDIPMVVTTADPAARLEVVEAGKQAIAFVYKEDFVAETLRVAEETALAGSEMVFAGYGIVAPEYNWNDYEGLDIRGKTVVVLVNDPGYATQDPALFNGRSMTYYGRWTYKFEEAARQGAAGVFIIHETEPAAYPWGVVQNGWTGLQFNLVREDNNMSRCAAEGWLHLDAARKVFALAGLNYDEVKGTAAKRGFKAVPLGLRASLTLKNTVRNVTSKNVIARLPGSERRDETIIYESHWDHFGKNPALEGDQIFNGAVDNATGTAALLELAEAFRKLKPAPARSIVFLAVTGEEQGLIGSEYYATHPVFPTAKTVSVINMDALNIYGPMKDITVVGYGLSDLDRYIEAAAQEAGRTVNPDPTPEKGSYFRSDHFPFAKQGIPAVYPSGGTDSVAHGKEWTLAQREKYTAEKYHKPSDEFDPGWDLSGAVDDLRLLFKVGYRLAMETTFPNWKEGTPYKAKRDADMAGQLAKPLPDVPADQKAALVAYLKSDAQSPEDYIVGKFETYDCVFLGEYHRIKHDVELIHALIPRLYKAGIHNLGIEFGCYEDQDQVDTLITGESYAEDVARRLMFRWFCVWGYQEYMDIYRKAWELNRTLPAGAPKFRVVNLNYRPDWKAATETMTDDLWKKVWWKGDPDRCLADVILKEFVAKGKKALVYSGSHHAFTRYHQPVVDFEKKQLIRFNNIRMGNLVLEKIPGRVFNIFLHSPWSIKDDFNQHSYPAAGVIDRLMREFKGRPVGFDVVGTPFGKIEDPQTYYAWGDEGFRLETFCDGYIYQKPFSEYEGCAVDPKFVTAENLQEAIDTLPNPAARKRLKSAADFLAAMRQDADMRRRFRDLE